VNARRATSNGQSSDLDECELSEIGRKDVYVALVLKKYVLLDAPWHECSLHVVNYVTNLILTTYRI
jgi:hypothetical protein